MGEEAAIRWQHAAHGHQALKVYFWDHYGAIQGLKELKEVPAPPASRVFPACLFSRCGSCVILFA